MLPARRMVWVADDGTTDAAIARSILAPQFEVRVFGDGGSVLEALTTDRPPDVLVLDWVMPGITGPEVCRFLRAAEGAASQVGILLVTAHRATDQVVEGLASGANDYLAKPYAPEELLARVHALVRGRELLERVQRAERTVARLLSHTPDGLVVVDAHGRLTYANPEAERLLGAPVASLIGRPVTEILPDLDLGALRRSADGVVALADVTIGGEVLAPIARLLPDDFAASATISLRNVTESRRTEARRLDFYSIIAHDLRTPLSAVLLRTAVIQTGRRGIVSAELLADIRKIENNVRSMVALINDFLELARLEGGYRLEREEVDAVALVRTAAEEIQPMVEASELRLAVDVPAGAVPVSVDRPRLMQVLTNLLSNAVKFTPAGGRVGVRIVDRADGVELRVSDDGPGIAAEAQQTLFQRYRRLDPSRGGTGLGLMIVREIVEAHGGEVGVESVLGEGSTFWVRIPRGVVRGASAEVLIVDDDVDLRDALRLVLESQGYTVAVAENGQVALESLRAGQIPAVIMIDMSMPVMTGPELLARLSEDARLARVPVLAMSGDLSVLPQAPPGALVLQKPLQIDRLLDYVGRHVRGEVAGVRRADAAIA